MANGKKITKNILWNVVAFGVAGVLGIITNIVIATFGNEKILGVYNQMMAYYIVIGQVASFGMQYSCVYFMTKAKDDREKSQINSSMLFCALIIGCLVAFFWYLFVNIGGRYIYRDVQMLKGLCAISVALILFGINKCIAGIMNAYEKMIRYALLQVLRYIVITVIVSVSVYNDSFYNYGMYCFLISEALGLIVGVIMLQDLFPFVRPRINTMRNCMQFGVRSMLGGIVNELNTKMDVLILGLFVPLELVGIYSFMTMIVEGCLSIINVIKLNFNPTFAKIIHMKEWEKLALYNKKLKVEGRIGIIFGMGIIVLGYWTLCKVFQLDIYLSAIVYLIILSVGVGIASPQLFKGSWLTLAGKPHIDSLISVMTVAVNCILNFIFIPKFQCYGAAFATMLSYIIYMVIIELVHYKQHILHEV